MSLLFATNARAAILIDVDQDKVLFSKNPDQELDIASLTKLMTLLIIIEKINAGTIKWNDWVEISTTAANTGGSIINLNAGDQLTVEDLFKGILIKSGNDASIAMAEFISGSVTEFVTEMNNKANELGLQHTHFRNPHGMSVKNHYSSAADLAKIALILMNNQDVLKVSRLKYEYIYNQKKWKKRIVNTNPLLGVIPEIDGLKTGVTNTALYCIAVTAANDHKRLLLILIGEPTQNERNLDVVELLEYGFSLD
jgi:serine-type D-Ala-D-Ala carboxypeptidase (penicillin-binding protein 5/6)